MPVYFSLPDEKHALSINRRSGPNEKSSNFSSQQTQTFAVEKHFLGNRCHTGPAGGFASNVLCTAADISLAERAAHTIYRNHASGGYWVTTCKCEVTIKKMEIARLVQKKNE